MTKKRVESVSLLSARKVGEAAVRPYLTLYRLSACTAYDDGTRSAPYPYDAVLRKWLDAVVIVLTATIDGETCVMLRSCIRPPMLIRHLAYTPTCDDAHSAIVLELPAGLIEPGDDGPDGIVRRARIETREETGYDLPEADFQLMKGAPLVTPGVLAERIWYARAVVTDVAGQQKPLGDGSPLEDHAETHWITLRHALQMCDNGEINDMKTELGLRRLERAG
jgi:8-oxo-dGTP pyrophosphatase MutT (NUDIX family)